MGGRQVHPCAGGPGHGSLHSTGSGKGQQRGGGGALGPFVDVSRGEGKASRGLHPPVRRPPSRRPVGVVRTRPSLNRLSVTLRPRRAGASSSRCASSSRRKRSSARGRFPKGGEGSPWEGCRGDSV